MSDPNSLYERLVKAGISSQRAEQLDSAYVRASGNSAKCVSHLNEILSDMKDQQITLEDGLGHYSMHLWTLSRSVSILGEIIEQMLTDVTELSGPSCEHKLHWH